MNKLDFIDVRFAKHEAMMAEVNSQLGVTEGQIQAVNKVVSEHANSIRYLTQEVKDLQNQNVDLKNRSRKQNLVYYGVNDDNRAEMWHQSEDLIRNICKAHVGRDINSIERAHRVGCYNERFREPIIVNFAWHQEKDDILSNDKKLKRSPFTVDQDYSPEAHNIRNN